MKKPDRERTNCNNWLGQMCDAFSQTAVHHPLCCNARNQGPICTAHYTGGGFEDVCRFPAGHPGPHEGAHGNRWSE